MLQQADVESLGWVSVNNSEKMFQFDHGLWTLELRSWSYSEKTMYPSNSDVIYIYPTYRVGNYDSFHGRCSDTETLSLLMELLNIKIS